MHPVDLDHTKIVFSEEQKLTFNQYVASTRIRAARNISGFSLPAGTSAEDREGVEKVLQQAFRGLSGELAGTYYKLGDLSDEQRDYLLERGFLFQIPTARNLLTGAGAARSWYVTIKNIAVADLKGSLIYHESYNKIYFKPPPSLTHNNLGQIIGGSSTMRHRLLLHGLMRKITAA